MHHIDPSLEKVIMLDADQLILKPLDHLFHINDALNVDLAAPRAYWIDKQTFSTAFMVISLSDRVWRKVQTALEKIKIDQYDMDIANEVFGDEVLMLPGSFVALNSHWEDWNLPRWFHGTDVVVAAEVDNGTEMLEIPKLEVKNSAGMREIEIKVLDKREEETQKPNHTLNTISHESESITLEGKHDSTSTIGKRETESLPVLPFLPKKADDKPPTTDHPHGRLPDTIPGITNPPKHGKSRLQDIVAPSSQSSPSGTHPTSTEPSNSDLKSRHLYNELFELYKQVSVLHYTAMTKPWGTNAMMIDQQRPDAHLLLKEQFMTWRKVAKDLCPPGLIGEL